MQYMQYMHRAIGQPHQPPSKSPLQILFSWPLTHKTSACLRGEGWVWALSRTPSEFKTDSLMMAASCFSSQTPADKKKDYFSKEQALNPVLLYLQCVKWTGADAVTPGCKYLNWPKYFVLGCLQLNSESNGWNSVLQSLNKHHQVTAHIKYRVEILQANGNSLENNTVQHECIANMQ